MTDNTQPEAGSTHIIRYALELGLLWIDGDGRDKVREALDALNTLEAQLEAIGAGGVSGPLMGIAAPPTAQAEGWRPVETAPKDGTHILLHAPACEHEGAPVHARTTYGHWSAPSDTPHIKYQDGFAPEPEWEDFEPFWASWDGGFTEEHPPTHWMPLPPPPTSAEGVEP